MRPKHWFYTLPLRLRSLFRRERAEHELSDELQFHLEQKTQEYFAAGLTIDEAHRKAQREFGGIELSKENCRDMRRVSYLQDLMQDLGFGLRMLRNSPVSLYGNPDSRPRYRRQYCDIQHGQFLPTQAAARHKSRANHHSGFSTKKRLSTDKFFHS